MKIKNLTINTTIKYALVDAGLTAGYVALVAMFFFYGQSLPFPKEDTVFQPMLMLSLLVFSAALVGSLIFGRPILWYLDNKKREAVLLLAYTLASFFVIICLFSILIFV